MMLRHERFNSKPLYTNYQHKYIYATSQIKAFDQNQAIVATQFFLLNYTILKYSKKYLWNIATPYR